MIKFWCLDCDHTWLDLDHSGCPECESMDVVWDAETATLNSWHDDGHFEGDFPSLPHGFDPTDRE
jgi:hypothetical protein